MAKKRQLTQGEKKRIDEIAKELKELTGSDKIRTMKKEGFKKSKPSNKLSKEQREKAKKLKREIEEETGKKVKFSEKNKLEESTFGKGSWVKAKNSLIDYGESIEEARSMLSKRLQEVAHYLKVSSKDEREDRAKKREELLGDIYKMQQEVQTAFKDFQRDYEKYFKKYNDTAEKWNAKKWKGDKKMKAPGH